MPKWDPRGGHTEPNQYKPIHRKTATLTLSGQPSSRLDGAVLMVPRLSLLTTCSDDSKPYMILKALDESYKNHIEFAIIRASGEEQ